MTENSRLIEITKKIFENFPKKRVKEKFKNYGVKQRGFSRVEFQRAKKNASLQIMDSLIMYGKRESENLNGEPHKSLSNTQLSEKDREYLYNKLRDHYHLILK